MNSAWVDYQQEMHAPVRPCASKSCPHPARAGRLACGDHDPGGDLGAYPSIHQPRVPDADAAELERLGERVRQRHAASPGADPLRVERMVRSAMPAEGTD